MRNRLLIGLLTGTIGVALLGHPSAATGAQGPANDASPVADELSRVGAPVAVGLAGNTLVRFHVDNPRAVVPLGRVQGLQGDSRLVGIDHRVQDDRVYGVGDQGGIYTLTYPGSTDRALAVRAEKVCQLSVALEGEFFGVDFNPAANRLRVISDTGQNLRHNIDDPNGAPAPGVTVVDGTLTNPDGTVATGVTAAAYTNDDLDPATATTLFDLDTRTDQVVLQSPANAGTLAPTGALGVDAGPDAGFDIRTDPATGANTGWAVLHTDGRARLYDVDLLGGGADPVGTFPRHLRVTDLTVLP
ncbi:DUF4394 domain-containing protein [Streptomyces spiramenti]|uniref:DUF4394 domain-containing protein n=1 Tax=Streptomyces spiramenti TaxID=2720606 RepID=A0ABX1ANG8_9ACTN|nr:DUF4394 domain-containing protein [Streptomyces spiramenti]NJP68632.1 DUF4394 domain-containing protein [Streptomyces spiramenti]